MTHRYYAIYIKTDPLPGYKKLSDAETNLWNKYTKSLEMTLYDASYKVIGDTFDFVPTLYKVYEEMSTSYLENQVQTGDFYILMDMPKPSSISVPPPAPAFLGINVEMYYDDYPITIESITIVPLNPDQVPERNKATAIIGKSALGSGRTFSFNVPFTSKTSYKSVTVAADGYNIKTGADGIKPHVRTATSFGIVNNADGTSTSDPQGCEIMKIGTQSISIAKGTGSENANSIEVGVKAGYEAAGASVEASTTFSKSWKTWASASNTSLISASSSKSMSVSETAPAGTIRIIRWDTTYQVNAVPLSDGLGNSATMEIVPQQTISVPSPTIVDFSEKHKRPRSVWEDLKSAMKGNPTIAPGRIDKADQDLNSKGWLT